MDAFSTHLKTILLKPDFSADDYNVIFNNVVQGVIKDVTPPNTKLDVFQEVLCVVQLPDMSCWEISIYNIPDLTKIVAEDERSYNYKCEVKPWKSSLG